MGHGRRDKYGPKTGQKKQSGFESSASPIEARTTIDTDRVNTCVHLRRKHLRAGVRVKTCVHLRKKDLRAGVSWKYANKAQNTPGGIRDR